MSRVEQGEQTREEILDIAMEMFAEQGYSGTSMRMIANACGTSQSLLHFHFGSKMDLYHSVLDRMQERYKGALEAPLSEESSTEEFLLEGLLERLRFYQRYPNRARIALWSALEETYEESRDMTRMRRDVADRLEQAKDQGLIQENVNVPLLAGMLVGVVGLWPLIRERYTEMLPRSERKDADEAYNRLVLEILSRGAGTEALQKALNNRDSD